jgi:hypothetical protein
VGVQAILCHEGQQLLALADPAGGSFDAAGDFDRLLRAADPSFPLLSSVDPHRDLELGGPEMPQLIAEIDRLLPLARPGPEHRGLLRLRTLARLCSSTPGTSLTLLGD